MLILAVTDLCRGNHINLIFNGSGPQQCFPVSSSCLREEGARDEQYLGSFQHQMPVQLGESQVIRNAEAQISNWGETWLADRLTWRRGVGLGRSGASELTQICIKHVELPVTCRYLSLFIHYHVGRVRLSSHCGAILGERAKGQPHLVIKGQLPVSVKQPASDPLIKTSYLLSAFIERLAGHIGKAFRKANHLCTLV